MRLIDGDALINEVNDSISNFAFTSPYQDEIEKVVQGMERVRDSIDDAPTIDPEELRPKGEWAKKDDGVCYWYECSECGEKPAQKHRYDYFSDFCPNCGADMRGDGNG